MFLAQLQLKQIWFATHVTFMSTLAVNARAALLVLALCQLILTAFGFREEGRDDDSLSLNSLDHHPVGLIEVIANNCYAYLCCSVFCMHW